jgi:hypothetical protein
MEKVFIYKNIEKAVKNCDGKVKKTLGSIDYNNIIASYCGKPVTEELAEQLASELFEEQTNFVQLIK